MSGPKRQTSGANASKSEPLTGPTAATKPDQRPSTTNMPSKLMSNLWVTSQIVEKMPFGAFWDPIGRLPSSAVWHLTIQFKLLLCNFTSQIVWVRKQSYEWCAYNLWVKVDRHHGCCWCKLRGEGGGELFLLWVAPAVWARWVTPARDNNKIKLWWEIYPLNPFFGGGGNRYAFFWDGSKPPSKYPPKILNKKTTTSFGDLVVWGLRDDSSIIFCKFRHEWGRHDS